MQSPPGVVLREKYALAVAGVAGSWEAGKKYFKKIAIYKARDRKKPFERRHFVAGKPTMVSS